MSQISASIESLLDWAQSNGSHYDASIEVYADDTTGISLRSKSDIAAGTNLVECSYKITLSYLNAMEASSLFSRHESDPFPQDFVDSLSEHDPNVIGHFFLVQQYLLGERSFWWHYIRLLPQPDEPHRLGTPIWWPASDQKFLDGTNAEPPIKKRRELWELQWERGIGLLKEQFEHWEGYTYILYQWAATIFGSRSFRPSLTILPELSQDRNQPLPKSTLISNQIKEDSFSILFPVLDIGNHCGKNLVDWRIGQNTFTLFSHVSVAGGSQIFNYYGDKSNSELLVGYGFMLPSVELDGVNLKVTPTSESQTLRRSQNCHQPVPSLPEQEFMFYIRMPVGQRAESCQEVSTKGVGSGALPGLFSKGLLDTTICMVANLRERQYIIENPDYCPEQDDSLFEGPLARSAYHALSILKAKVEYEMNRLVKSTPSEAPTNRNQHLASDYRKRQVDVLESTLPLISKRLGQPGSDFFSLESAFKWLQTSYPDVSRQIEQFISEDQQEALPLDWDMLVTDWDHTYWIAWLYIVFTLTSFESRTLYSQNPRFYGRLANVSARTLTKVDQLYAEPSEIETVNSTTQAIAKIFGHSDETCMRVRNSASLAAKEETVRIEFLPGEGVDQKLLWMPSRY